MTIIVNKAVPPPAGGGGGTTLPPIGTIAPRPIAITGCLQTFIETTLPNTVRTQSDDNTAIQVRRRATHTVRTANASAMVPQSQVEDWRHWFEQCLSGVLPTRFIMPYGVEEVWRFASEPKYNWQQGKAQGNHLCQIEFNMEQLPHWK